MFTCSVCKQPQPANTPIRRAPAAARPVSYRAPGGKETIGHEVIREATLCPTCPAPTIVLNVTNVDAIKSIYHDPNRGRKKPARDEKERDRG